MDRPAAPLTIETYRLYEAFLRILEKSNIKRKSEVKTVLCWEALPVDTGENLQMFAMLGNMLAKEDGHFFFIKGETLGVIWRFNCVLKKLQVFKKPEEGVVYVVSDKYGVKGFHQDPKSLERLSGWEIPLAYFDRPRIRRQKQTLDELLDPDLLAINVKRSCPLGM